VPLLSYSYKVPLFGLFYGLSGLPVALVCLGVPHPASSVPLTHTLPPAPAPHIPTRPHTSPHIPTHPDRPPYDKCGLIVDETLDGNPPRSGKLNAGVNFYNFYKGQSHTGYEQADTLQLFFVQDDDNDVWVTTNFGGRDTQDWIGTTVKGNNVGGSKTFIVFKDDPGSDGSKVYTDKGTLVG